MIRLLVGAGGLAFLTACSGPLGSSQQPTTQGYLGQGSGYVEFLQLTRSGDQLSGSLQSATWNGSQIQSKTLPFHGLAQGSQLSLTFELGLGTSSNLTGHFQGSHLVVFVPLPSGQIGNEDMGPSDSQHYNQAVSELQQQGFKQQQTTQQNQAAQTSPSGGGQVWACVVGVGGGPGVDINAQMAASGFTPSSVCGKNGGVPFRRYIGPRPVEKSACNGASIVYELHLDGDSTGPIATTAYFDENWSPVSAHCP